MELPIAKVLIELEAVEELRLPSFKGSTFRGAMGRVLKEMVCIRRDRDCPACPIRGKCSYTFIFETGVYFGEEGQPEKGGVSQPFVLEPPQEEKQQYKAGDKVEFGLVLIGRGIDYLPYFISAFDLMAAKGLGKGRGKLELCRVLDAYADQKIYDRESGEIDTGLYTKTMGDFNSYDNRGNCNISLVTPLRLKQGGVLAVDLDFELLIRAILRRVTYLGQYFGGGTPGFDFRELISSARDVAATSKELRWRDWERYSSRSDRRMKLGGIVGEVVFQGNLEPFWPLLLIGQEVHIGKNSTFGLGKYEVISSSG